MQHLTPLWIVLALLASVLLVAGSGLTRAAVPGGHLGGGRPPADGAGRGGRFGGPGFPRTHRGPRGFVSVYPYPYFPYSGYAPGYPYDEAYCDPWSDYYSLDLCYDR
jgi:hypothetical protein